MITASDFLKFAEINRDFLKTFIIGDKLSVNGNNPKIKAQLSVWKFLSSPKPKKAIKFRSKVLLIFFFDKESVSVTKQNYYYHYYYYSL